MASVFISYTHEDEALKNKFLQHLAPLKRQGLLSVWHDRMLSAGEHLDESVQRELASADLIVLLVSAAFINSQYCYEEEMVRAFRRRASGEARVMTLVLKPCQWMDVPVEGGKLRDFLAAPTDGRPVTKWEDEEEAFSVAASMLANMLKDSSVSRPISHSAGQSPGAAADEQEANNGSASAAAHQDGFPQTAPEATFELPQRDGISADENPSEFEGRPSDTSAPRTLRVAVLSDLHVFVGSASDGTPPSFIGTADALDAPTRHPLAGLKTLIAKEHLTADLLICPGDMTNQAEPTSLNVAWGYLHALAEWLGAAPPLATNGNHDLDSRYQYNDYDAKGAIQSLVPRFPGLSDQQCDQYWARNYVMVHEQEYRVVLLNSAAYHGVGRDDQEREYKHGRISERTLAALEQTLSSFPAPMSILVCHHHPLPFNPLGEGDYSHMEGGERLIEMLASGEFGRWLVIHGHKHFPRLTYGTGAVTPPVMFSAGSFSALLHPKVAQHARNQFYILELRLDALEKFGLDIAGTVTAWDWITLKGWQEAGPQSGIPRLAGFGWQEAPGSIARQIAGRLPTSGSVLRWEELRAEIPRLNYLLPQTLDRVFSLLRDQHGVVTTMSGGNVVEVGRP